MMRKYFIGGLVGLMIGLSATAYADDLNSLVGSKIQGETAVYLDGDRLDTAIIVDGKSYAPTRKIAEASGKDVTFNTGGIYLESQETTAPEPTPAPVPQPTPDMVTQPTETPAPAPTYRMEAIDQEIKDLTIMVRMINATIEEYNKNTTMTDEQRQQAIDGMQSKLDIAQTELDKWVQRKADLETQQ